MTTYLIMLMIVGVIMGIDLYYSYSYYNDDTSVSYYSYAETVAALPKTIYPPIEELQTSLLKFKKANSPSFDCTKIVVPTPLKNFTLDNIYKDGTGSTIRDEEKVQKNNLIKKPVTDMKNLVVDLVRDMVITNPSETKKIQDCLLNAIYSWASKGALTGSINGQGYVERVSLVIPVAAAFLKINQLYPNDNRVNVIKKWLETMEKGNWNNFKGRTTNLKTWAVLAHYLVAIATQNEDMYNESLREFVKQVNFIEDSGTIKTELERKQLASRYIVYYAAPLVTMQYMLKVTNNPAYNQPKIHNLVNLVINMYKDPQYLVKNNLTGDKQEALDGRMEFLNLYDVMFNTEFIQPENKDVFTQQANVYKNNIKTVAFNVGNLASMFGV